MIEPGISRQEEDLLRLVDGALTVSERAQILERVAADPVLAARVADDERIKAELSAAFDPVIAEHIPDRLMDALASGTGRRVAGPMRGPAIWMQALAASLILAVGLGGGWFARSLVPFEPQVAAIEQTASFSLPREAAVAHKVYVVEVRHPVEVGASEEAHLFQWLSRRLGTSVKAPPLTDQGFSLVGGRLLPNPSGPAAQFMYEAASGERLTLYVAINQSNQETAFRFEAQDDTSMFYWIDGSVGYALMGALPRDRLLPIARTVYERLGS